MLRAPRRSFKSLTFPSAGHFFIRWKPGRLTSPDHPISQRSACSQIFPITGKLTGTFPNFRKKTAFSAQIPQFLPQEQGLTGNFQFVSQAV
jgi:hypothetical protein